MNLMNRRERPYPHPAVLYLALLVLVILVSWIGGVYESRNAGPEGETVLRGLLNAQGLRWLVRMPATALADAPVGNALLILAGTGIGIRGGWLRIWSLIISGSGLKTLSRKERSAFFAAFLTLAIILGLVAYGVFGPGNVLLNASGGLFKSPIAQGSLFMLFLALALPSAVYGLASDRIRDSQELIKSFSYLISLCSSYFFTLFIASLLVAAFRYSNLDRVLKLDEGGVFWLRMALYWLPLPEILYFDKNKIRS